MRGFLRGLAAEGRAVFVSSHLMSELQDTADHLVVVGRGKVIADASVADLIAAASDDRVELRTAARAEAMTVLARAGAEVAATAPDVLTIKGLSAERTVAALTADRCPVHRGERPPGDPRGGLHGAHQGRGGIPGRRRHRGHGAMTAITPYRSTAREARDGFGQLLHAEWTKFRTVRGWVVGMIVAVLIAAGIGLLRRGRRRQPVVSVGGRAGQLRRRMRVRARADARAGRRAGDRQLLLRPPAAGRERQHHRPGDVADQPAPAGRAGVRRDPGPARPGAVVQGRDHHQVEPRPGVGVRGDDGHRRQRRADAVELHRRRGRPARRRLGREPALAPADPRRRHITGYDSADGASWTSVGVGAAGGPARHRRRPACSPPRRSCRRRRSTSPGSPREAAARPPSSAVFDHLSRSGAWPAGTWTGGYTEGDQAAEAQGIGGFRQASGRITVTGQGDIAPALPQGEPGLSEVHRRGLPHRHVRRG